MRLTTNPSISPGRLARSGPARYTALLVGLGAAGVALGWLGPDVARTSREQVARTSRQPAQLIRRR